MNNRVWFAEDIALVMEMLSHRPYRFTAKHFNVSEKTLRNMISNAKKYGFDAYPKRFN